MSWDDGWQWATLVLLAYRIAILKLRVEKHQREEAARWRSEDEAQ